MATSMLLLSAYGAYGEHLPFRNFMTIALLLMYIITSTFGFLTIPFTMIAELFNIDVKGLAAGISVSFCYFTSFLSIKMYPFLVESLGSSTVFLIYGIISIFATVFVFIILPETKGKTLEEIENLFKSRSSRTDADVKETSA
jgi:facilitated trehalose transporter